MLFFSQFRTRILTSLTGTKERDEREVFISGMASKGTFLATLSLLIFLLFLSGFHYKISHKIKDPGENSTNSYTRTSSIGYNFEFFEKEDKKILTKDKPQSHIYFEGLPLSKQGILLLLIIFHLGSYHLLRRQQQS